MMVTRKGKDDRPIIDTIQMVYGIEYGLILLLTCRNIPYLFIDVSCQVV
jgi:hypothetical protein